MRYLPPVNALTMWLTSLYVLTLIYSCDDVTRDEMSDPSMECDQLRCDPGVCALLEGEARCFCPDGYFRDTRGRCLMGAEPIAGMRAEAEMSVLPDIPSDMLPIATDPDLATDPIDMSEDRALDRGPHDLDIIDSGALDSSLIDLGLRDYGDPDLDLDASLTPLNDMSVDQDLSLIHI